ncbi:DUF2635 domain-containing protein [Bombella apis]|uniref:DUF2635 domain-containing protein n=1 Tax=Bombella apis TaxID=1785988 RepID=UPI0024A8FB9D|nr:DUF2635 domain-containing protein [Bombella apis]
MSENTLLTVRAADGRRVVTPAGAAVPAGGFRVDPRDPWWARALASGDVVELAEADLAAMKAASEQKKAGPAQTAPASGGTGSTGEKK